MNKIISKIFFSFLALTGFSACSGLDVESPSVVNQDFVFSEPSTARAALLNAYEGWRNSMIHSNGLFMLFTNDGSDIEKYGVSFLVATQFQATCMYHDGTSKFPIDDASCKAAWDNGYKVINQCNTLCASFEGTPNFSNLFKDGQPSELSQIYGEAVALRATIYFELLRYFGDIPHSLVSGELATGLTPRDQIYDYHIKKLMEVEPYMYRCGESTDVPNTSMTRTYVQGLIARLCLYAGGYSTRRTDLGDDFYTDSLGNKLTFSKVAESAENKCFYGRRTDYKKYYEIAQKYLRECIKNPGTAELCTVDPRSDNSGRVYNNPFQYIFEQMDNNITPNENVYEIPENKGVYSERPYTFGRVSDGGNRNYYPCRCAGSARLAPYYFYGDFSPLDKRRDATCAVTGSTGQGAEKLIPWIPGNKASGGGMSGNKWDDNRMTDPWTKSQRQSGVNNPYMRFADIILMLAEVDAELGDETEAVEMLTKVRARAFGDEQTANVQEFIAHCGGLSKAIQEERKLEFGGEGLRRFDLVRTGLIYDAVRTLHKNMTDMINGLKTKGYFEFPNGNVISNYVWTKLVDAKTKYGYRLTATGVKGDPVLYPGWRGQHDSWESFGCNYGTSTPATNLAIEGLFEYIDPDGDRAKALEADGYKRENWGIDIVAYDKEYNDYLLCGVKDNEPPIYLLPINPVQIRNSNGTITNGYGFRNTAE